MDELSIQERQALQDIDKLKGAKKRAPESELATLDAALVVLYEDLEEIRVSKSQLAKDELANQERQARQDIAELKAAKQKAAAGEAGPLDSALLLLFHDLEEIRAARSELAKVEIVNQERQALEDIADLQGARDRAVPSEIATLDSTLVVLLDDFEEIRASKTSLAKDELARQERQSLHDIAKLNEVKKKAPARDLATIEAVLSLLLQDLEEIRETKLELARDDISSQEREALQEISALKIARKRATAVQIPILDAGIILLYKDIKDMRTRRAEMAKLNAKVSSGRKAADNAVERMMSRKRRRKDGEPSLNTQAARSVGVAASGGQGRDGSTQPRLVELMEKHNLAGMTTRN